MKLLVTGATGFIGGHLIKRLQIENHDVVAIVRSESNIEILRKEGVGTYVFENSLEDFGKFLEGGQFDGIIHLASLFLAQHTPEDIPSLIQSNIVFPTQILETVAQHHIPWFINTGTFWQHYDNKSYSPVNLYAATKQGFEDIARYYLETSDINFVTLKLSDTFGPDDTRPKITNLLINLSESGDSIDMSPGEQLLDMSYIDNVIDAYMRLIELVSHDPEKKLKGKSFAVKAQKRVSLKELAQLIEEITRTTLAINWGKRPYRPREVMIPWHDGEIVPGWEARVPLEGGIRKILAARHNEHRT